MSFGGGGGRLTESATALAFEYAGCLKYRAATCDMHHRSQEIVKMPSKSSRTLSGYLFMHAGHKLYKKDNGVHGVQDDRTDETCLK